MTAGGQRLDDALTPLQPLVPEPRALGGKARVDGIEQVRQQVDADRRRAVGEPAAGHLHPRDDGQPAWPRRLGDRPPGGGVVVGERDDVEARGLGSREQVGDALGAVGDGGVGVQVDPHRRSACLTAPAGTRPN
jgi:hypothetical protein